MFKQSPLTLTIGRQLSTPVPLFDINWYTDRIDQYVRILSFASYAEAIYPDAYSKMPHDLLIAMEDARYEKTAGKRSDDMIIAEPASAAMVNLTLAAPKDCPDVVDLAFDLTNEFFMLTGELCGMSRFSHGDTLLIFVGADYKKNSVEIERFNPEKKYLFASFLEQKGLITDEVMEETGALLGLGEQRYKLSQEKLDNGPQYQIA